MLTMPAALPLILVADWSLAQLMIAALAMLHMPSRHFCLREAWLS